MKFSKDNIPEVLPLVNAFDLFNNTVSDLDLSYKELIGNIEELNLKISEKNKFVEKNFLKVNRMRSFFDSILNSMRDGVIVVDTTGKIVLFNESIVRLTGYTRDEVIGEPYKKIFGKKVSERFSLLFTLAESEPLVMEEKEIITKFGHKKSVRYSTSLVTDNEDTIIGAVEVWSDLTRIKRLEEQMQMAKTQTALNQMAGLVAHEVRNPLGGIRGYIDLLKESFDGSDKRREMIEKICILIEKLDKIVVNFLIMARPVKPNMVKTDIKLFVNDVMDYFCKENDLKEKNIDLEKIFFSEPESLFIRIDPILLEQAIIMVLDNAVKAMKIGGLLTVEVNLKKSSRNYKNLVSIDISDSGVGMLQEIKEKIFNPFFTTREKGMGLGLSLTKNFIMFHNGDVIVDSEEGIGTTVSITLPQD